MLSGSSRHLTALIGAGMAETRAFLAMFVIVFSADITAFLADGGTGAAKFFSEIAAAGHGRGGQLTDLGAIEVGADAVCHPLRVWFA